MARSPRRELEKDNPPAPQIYQSFRRRLKPVAVAAKDRAKKETGTKANR